MNETLKVVIIQYLQRKGEYAEKLDLEPFRVKESLDDICKILEGLGAKVDTDEMGHNGWQMDVWIPFTFENKNYNIFYCAYYNNGMSISIDD